MSSVMSWMFLQVVMSGVMVAWYAKKHPSDAMQMFMKWRRFFTKS